MLKQIKVSRPILYLLLGTLVIIIIGISLYALKYHNAKGGETTATAEPRLTAGKHIDGWYHGPSNETSLTLFSESRSDGTSACFVTMEVINGTADKPKDLEQIKSAGDITPINTTKLFLNTSNGKKDYRLNNYSAQSSSGNAMKGLALGYIQLDDEYVKVDGHCEDENQLKALDSALESYKLD